MPDGYVKSSSDTDGRLTQSVSQAAIGLRMPRTGFAPSAGLTIPDPMAVDNIKVRARKRVARGGAYANRGTEVRIISNRYVEESIPVRTYAAAARWTVREERAAALSNESIPQNDLDAVVEDLEAWDDELSLLGASGDLSASDSFANSSVVTKADLANNFSVAATTAKQVADQVSSAYGLILEALKGTGEAPNRLALAPAVYSRLAMLTRDGVEGSVLVETLRNLGITAFPLEGLQNAAAGNKPRAIMYSASPSTGVWAKVMPPTMADVYVKGFNREQEAMTRSAGFFWIDTAGVRYLDEK